MNLPLFQTPKPIDSHFKSDSDIVLFTGDIKDLLAEIPDNSINGSALIAAIKYNRWAIGSDVEEEFINSTNHRFIPSRRLLQFQ